MHLILEEGFFLGGDAWLVRGYEMLEGGIAGEDVSVKSCVWTTKWNKLGTQCFVLVDDT